MIKFKLLIVLLCFSVAAQADMVKGLEWLSAQQDQTGDIASGQDSGIDFQNVSETLTAFALPDHRVALDQDKTRTFLNDIGDNSSEYLARQIMAQFSAGESPDIALQALVKQQNKDGGFSFHTSFSSSVLNTGYALQALAVAKGPHQQNIENAIGFLLQQQNPDGSFGYVTKTQRSVFTTAIVVRALQQYLFDYNLSDPLQRATDFLQQAPLTDDHERALVLLAVVPLTTDASHYATISTALSAGQNSVDGHWENDVYTTALALQALHLVANIKFPVDVTTGQINGRFVDDATGFLLANVAVTSNVDLSTQSADDGTFTLNGASAGSHTLAYQLAGYETATQAMTVQAGQIINLGVLRLTPVSGNGILSGVVTDADTGVALFEVGITVIGTETFTTVTDRSGAYHLAIPVGDVSVSATLSGYTAVSGAGAVIAGGNLSFSPALNKVGETPTPPTPNSTAEIFGKVVDANGSAAIAQAEIRLVEINATNQSKADGTFRFAALDPAELTLQISAAGYHSVQTTLLVPANTRIDLGLLRLTQVPPTDSLIVGQVIDAEYKTPLVGASVSVQNKTVLTDADGRYRVAGVEVGQSTLSVDAVGYQVRTGHVDITTSTQIVANFALSRNVVQSFDIVSIHTEDGGHEYDAFGEVGLGVMLLNSGTQAQLVRLFLTVADANGDIIEQFPAVRIPLGGLAEDAWVNTQPGEITETEVEWHFGSVPAGRYQLIVQAYDGPSGQLLAERDQFVDVLATTRIGGMASFEPPITQLASQQPVNIIASIGNNGNLPIDAGSITATVTLKNAGPKPPQALLNVSLLADKDQVNQPNGMTESADGSVYVANRGSHSVSKILPDGSVIKFADGFSYPSDVEVDAEGNVYVLNRSHNFVKISPAGVRTQIPTGLSSQVAIEVLPDGRVLIIRANTLSEVSVDGTITTRISGGLSDPVGMAIDSHDRLFIANRRGNSVSMFADGILSTFAEGINQPFGLAVDANDDLYVTSFMDNTLHKITSDGTITTVATGLSGPYDVKIGPSGRPVVSNQHSHSVVRIEADGRITELVGPTIAKPYAAAYDAAGNVFVGNYATRNIVKFNPEHQREAFTGAQKHLVRSIATHANGDLSFLANEQVYRVEGEETTQITQNALTGANTIINDGNRILVSQLDQITQIDDTGVATPYILPQFKSPILMRQATNGDKYILNPTYITRITPEGLVSRVVDGLDARTSSMALDANGNLFVTEFRRKNVLKISPQGNVEVFAQTTFSPSAITVAENGHILVATYGGKTVFSIDPQGTVSEFKQVSQPIYYDMLFDRRNQNLWMMNNHGLSKLDAAGQEIQVFLRNSRALTLANEGGVYVAAPGSIHHVSDTGEIEKVISNPIFQSQYLISAVRDEQSRWWILHINGQLTRLTADKQVDKRYSSLSLPWGITLTANNDLIVANVGNALILRITNPDTLPEIVASGAYQKIAVESTGSILLANTSTVKRLDIDSGEITNLIDGFSSIQALAASPTGDIFVGDYTRNKMAYYQHDGQLISSTFGVRAPKGILFDADGQLLIANASPPAILSLKPNGTTDVFVNRATEYMWLESNGDITASHGSIFEYRRDGSLKRNFGRVSYGLVRTSSGQLVVTDNQNNQNTLVQYSENNQASIIASGLSQPQDIEANSTGDIFIAERGSGLITRILPDFSIRVMAEGLPSIGRLNIDKNNRITASYQSHLAMFDSDGTRNDIVLGSLVFPRISGLNRLSDGRILATTQSDHKIHDIRLGQTTPGLQVGDTVFNATTSFPSLAIGAPVVALDFGMWTPDVSGDYLLTLETESGAEGQLSNTLHVGPNASSTLSLHQEQVFPGDRTATSTLNIIGADSTSITRIDADATALAATSGALGRAIGADTKGNIYASAYTRIVKITPDGIVSDFVTGLPGLGNGMAVDSKDNLYVISSRQVLKITPDGDVSTFAQLSETVTAVAVDYHDAVFVVSNTLSRIHPDGRIEALASTPNAQSLTIDVLGNFYVLVVGHKILRVAPDYQVSVYFDDAKFEYEGVNVTADCANNLLFAPTQLLPFQISGEEDTIIQLIGANGETNLVLNGPSIDPLLRDMDVLFYDRFGQRLLIWTDLNQGQIFSFPVICGGIDVDAHIVTRADVDLASSHPAPTRMIDRGDGTQEAIWSLKDVDQRGFDLQLNWLFKNLGEGETRAVAQAAFLVFSNSFRPGETVKVPIDVPSLLAASRKYITPMLDAARYSANARVGIQVAIGNDSGTAFNGTLKLSITDAQGNLAETLPDISINEQPVLSEQAVASEWFTGQRFQGDYQLQVRLLDENSITVAKGQVPFLIDPSTQPNTATVSTITPEKLVYESTDRVQLLGRIRNTATNARQGNSIARVTVTGPTQQILFTDSRALSELLPGSLKDISFQVTLDNIDPGEYRVNLLITDSITGTTLDNSSNRFQVQPHALLGLVGQVTLNATLVQAGTPMLCTETVVHTGRNALADGILRHLLVSLDGIELTTSAVTPPAPGNTATVVQTIDTSTLNGGYACVLQVNLNNTWETLASAGFGIKPSPLQQLQGSLTVSAPETPQGEPVVCSDTLTNSANNALQGVNITRTFVDLANGDIIQTQTDLMDLAANARQTQSHTLNTAQLEEGAYRCRLSAEQNGQSIPLAELDFTLIQPPIRIQATLTPALNQGRLLVLMPGQDSGQYGGGQHGSGKYGNHHDNDETDEHHDTGGSGQFFFPTRHHEQPGGMTTEQQRQFLETLLLEKGWSYTIVTDKHEFINRLRQGGYSAYALMPGHSHIPTPLQKDIREATFRGEGLLVMANHNLVYEHAIGDTLGIDFHGGHVVATSINVISSPLHADSTNVLLNADLPMAQSLGATIAASAAVAHYGRRHSETTIAAAYQNYGHGKAVYIGYDLLSEGVADQDPFHRAFLSQALDYLQGSTRNLHIGDSFAVNLQLENQGVAVNGRVLFDWPQAITPVAVNAPIDLTTDPITWPYHLLDNEQRGLTLWLQAKTAGLFGLTADIETDNNGTFEQHQHVELNMAVQYPAGFTDIRFDSVIVHLETLESAENCSKHKYTRFYRGSTKACYQDVLENVLAAEQQWQENNAENALEKLFKATDDLIQIQGDSAASTRHLISHLIRHISQLIEIKH